jgi:hypothetical protein
MGRRASAEGSISHIGTTSTVSRQFMLIVTISLLRDAWRTPAGHAGSGLSLRQHALDPGFHDVLAGPAHTNRDADDVGVS